MADLPEIDFFAKLAALKTVEIIMSYLKGKDVDLKASLARTLPHYSVEDWRERRAGDVCLKNRQLWEDTVAQKAQENPKWKPFKIIPVQLLVDW